MKTADTVPFKLRLLCVKIDEDMVKANNTYVVCEHFPCGSILVAQSESNSAGRLIKNNCGNNETNLRTVHGHYQVCACNVRTRRCSARIRVERERSPNVTWDSRGLWHRGIAGLVAGRPYRISHWHCMSTVNLTGCPLRCQNIGDGPPHRSPLAARW